MSIEKMSSEEIRSSGMNDDKLVDEHVRLNEIKHEPTKGFLQAPLIFVFVFGCLIFVCSIQLAHTTNDFALHPPEETEELSPDQKEDLRKERKISSGEKIFAARCASCHQTNGLGIAGQYPPLAGSEWVTSDPGIITNIILKGLKGEIVVKGETYGKTAAMNMAAVDIDDSEIANVVSYVRQAWGNKAEEIFEDEVASIRADSTEKQDQWTGDQIISMYPESFAK